MSHSGLFEDLPLGSVIIPAHNEAAVITRTLTPLAELAAVGALEVIVACNGCTDDTAELARLFSGVVVIEVEAASKTAALNAGDARASSWPRLYLDADIEIDASAAVDVLHRLSRAGGPLAARPAFRYELGGLDPFTRAYYRTRGRIPALHQHLWGAGAYAVSETGHRRFGAFPTVTADDLWIDRQFTAAEIAVVGTVPVRVRPPRSMAALLYTLVRVYGGNRAAEPADGGGTSTIGLREVAHTVRGPRSALDAMVYTGFAVAGRLASRARRVRWARDESSRVPDSVESPRVGVAR